MMMYQLAIFLGGGLGAVLRNLIYFAVNKLGAKVWLGTFTVNIIGSLLLVGLGQFLKELPENYVGFLRVGFLGGLTTFSTLSLDVFNCVKSGNYIQAGLIVFLNIFFGIIVGIILFE